MGGAGIVVGLSLYGYKVIQAIGIRLTPVTPSRGFNIELSTAFVVVVASRIGVPISTTHCQVGGTFAVGLAGGMKNIHYKTLIQTLLSWVVTVIFAGLVSALLFSVLVYSPNINSFAVINHA